jgi:hypothetical protein
MISRSLTLWEANEEAEIMPRLDLGYGQGNGRPTVDAVLHRAPDALGDVEEALLETLTLGAHVDHGGVRGLANHL